MKTILRLSLAASLALSLFPTPAKAAPVKIPAGTPVNLRLLQRVHSAANIPGEIVSLTVNDDVIIDGKTVIPKGSKAIGKITMLAKAGLVGIPGRIRLEFQSVTTPDRVDVPLGGVVDSEGHSRFVVSVVCGIFCLFPLLISGEQTALEEGTVFPATILSTTEVDVH